MKRLKLRKLQDYGLSSGVITNNLQDAMKVAASLRTGMVAVNGSGGFRAQELPFGGGKKMSGNSRECNVFCTGRGYTGKICYFPLCDEEI